MKKIMCFAVIVSLLFSVDSYSQNQYKLRQVRSVMGMKMESTVYVKGMRKRTENAPMMGMTTPTEIQQCDLKRTIKINDKKKVYYIEPFAKDDEVIDETEKPTKPVVNTNKPVTTQKGGTIYMYYNITDTGERKKMFDFTARHVWTTQKMKPSPDACMMKDSFIIKTDGWYIDLPEFNCPISYRPTSTGMSNPEKPACMDKFVTRKTGKGKLGFPLIETTTMIMSDGQAKTTEFKTDLETLEFSTAKLDSSLFTIPAGYTEVKTEAELQDKFDMSGVVNQVKTMNQNNGNQQPVTEQKAAGVIRIGVFEPKGEGVSSGELQRYLAGILSGGKVQGIAVSSEEEAKKMNCDFSLNTEFVRIKQGGKVGGLIKAIKNADPNAASNYTIENSLVLKKLGDGSVRLQQRLEGKYDGKLDEAAKRSLDEESQLVLRTIN